MDALKAQLEKIKQQLAGLTATQRMLVTTLIGVMVLTLLYWGHYAGSSEMAPLLDQSLSPTEIGKINQALDLKGVVHTTVGDKVMVPADRKMELVADLMYQNMLQPGTASGQTTVVPTGLQLGLGTRAASNEIVFSQGSFSETDNPLDLVIQGNGFFQIQMPNGTTAYTRAGSFQMDKNGNIVTGQGYPLNPQITIPATAQQITIASDGTVLCRWHTGGFEGIAQSRDSH